MLKLRMFVVFLNNKLISCDSILPIMMEIHKRTNKHVRFYVTDAESYDSIRENVVLKDAIEAIGSIKLVGRRKRGLMSWLSHRITVGSHFFGLAMQAAFGRVEFFHFKALNVWPLRFLYWINRKRTIYCESSSYGEPAMMAAVGMIGYQRQFKQTRPAADVVLAFHNEFPALHRGDMADVPKFVFGPSRTWKTWLDYIRERADADFGQLYATTDIGKSDKIVAYMLGYFGPIGYLRNGSREKMVQLLHETLDVLAAHAAGMPILLKPHIFTDLEIVKSAISSRPRLRAAVTYLHPCVLATRASFFVANYYSSTLSDAHELGVPTIEYTDYGAEALDVTNGGSMHPEVINHFINADPAALSRVVSQLSQQPRSPIPQGRSTDESGFFDFVARSAA